ncbi:hypothetical protein PspLS_03683 [Pyricularia sp. CBS 133598]|nr:hypothetical protein PspLS_03683 [Pyricularia sp. CBS 133598]
MQFKTAYVFFTLAHFAIAAPSKVYTDETSPIKPPRGSTGGLSPLSSPRGSTGGLSPPDSPRIHSSLETNIGASSDPSGARYLKFGEFWPNDHHDEDMPPRDFTQQAIELGCNGLLTCLDGARGTLMLAGSLTTNCVRRYRKNQAKDRKALGISDGYIQKAKEHGCNALETCFEAAVGAGLVVEEAADNCLRRFGEFRYRNAKAQNKPYEPLKVELAPNGLPLKAADCCVRGARNAFNAACRCWANHSQGYQDFLEEAREARRQLEEEERRNNGEHGDGPLPESPRTPRTPKTPKTPQRPQSPQSAQSPQSPTRG